MVKKSAGISHFSFLSLPFPLFSLTSMVSRDVIDFTTTHYLLFPPSLLVFLLGLGFHPPSRFPLHRLTQLSFPPFHFWRPISQLITLPWTS